MFVVPQNLKFQLCAGCLSFAPVLKINSLNCICYIHTDFYFLRRKRVWDKKFKKYNLFLNYKLATYLYLKDNYAFLKETILFLERRGHIRKGTKMDKKLCRNSKCRLKLNNLIF